MKNKVYKFQQAKSPKDIIVLELTEEELKPHHVQHLAGDFMRGFENLPLRSQEIVINAIINNGRKKKIS